MFALADCISTHLDTVRRNERSSASSRTKFAIARRKNSWSWILENKASYKTGKNLDFLDDQLGDDGGTIITVTQLRVDRRRKPR